MRFSSGTDIHKTSIDIAVRYRHLFTRYVKSHSLLNSKNQFDVNKNLKTRREDKKRTTYLATPPRQWQQCKFYLSHYCTHISKQILEYIFSLNKYIESLDAVLINQLTSAILQQYLTIIFYTVLTEI